MLPEIRHSIYIVEERCCAPPKNGDGRGPYVSFISWWDREILYSKYGKSTLKIDWCCKQVTIFCRSQQLGEGRIEQRDNLIEIFLIWSSNCFPYLIHRSVRRFMFYLFDWLKNCICLKLKVSYTISYTTSLSFKSRQSATSHSVRCLCFDKQKKNPSICLNVARNIPQSTIQIVHKFVYIMS